MHTNFDFLNFLILVTFRPVPFFPIFPIVLDNQIFFFYHWIMEPRKFGQEIIKIIAKLPSWVSAAVGILSTIILAFSLIQKNFVAASLILSAILWMSCLYVWMKRTEPLIAGGTGLPAFPKWRSFAVFGLIVIPVIIVVAGIFWFNRVQTDVKVDTIAITNFAGPKQEEYALTQLLLENLRGTVNQEKNVRVKALQDTINAQLGPDRAREVGKQNNADLLIWGWYGVTAKNVMLNIHFELLGILAENNLPFKYEKKTDVAQLENFALQISLSQELTSMSLLVLGVLKYQEGDYEKANHYFSLIDKKEDLPPDLKRILDYYKITYFVLQNNYDSAISRFERVAQTFPEGLSFPELFENVAIAYNKSGNFIKMAYNYEKAGNQYEAITRHANAITCYDQAREQCQKTGNRIDEYRLLTKLAIAYNQAKDYKKAEIYLADASLISKKIGDKKLEMEILNEIKSSVEAAQASFDKIDGIDDIIKKIQKNAACEIERVEKPRVKISDDDDRN